MGLVLSQIFTGIVFFLLIFKRKINIIKNLKYLIISGVLAVLYAGSYWISLSNGDPAIADFIKTQWVILLFIVTHRSHYFNVLITIIGLGIIFYQPGISFNWWTCFAFISALSFPLIILVREKMSKINSVLEAVALAEITSALFWAILLVVTGRVNPSANTIYFSLFYSMVISVPSMYLFQLGRDKPAVISSLLPSFTPVFGAIILFSFAGIELSPNLIIGGALLTLNIIYIKYTEFKETRQKKMRTKA